MKEVRKKNLQEKKEKIMKKNEILLVYNFIWKSNATWWNIRENMTQLTPNTKKMTQLILNQGFSHWRVMVRN